eukprot:TRINITY_DN15959_c0_g5_i1.p1 TRINITY_DN15959_c0_g5~~TRINITY_DN15959_c0_g5_i1.p1  ORF type:complete len:558 (-),score=117.26 TRINITY_DN15959_c0_g5_i1:153-1775(-)
MSAARTAMRGGARGLWLRNDLRVDDNLALQAAAGSAEALLPMFVFDPEKFSVPTLAGCTKSSARRARFLLESVVCMRKRLEGLGSGLAVAVGAPSEVIPKLSSGLNSVTVTQGFCSEEYGDEVRVAKHLKKGGTELQKVWGGSLYMPEDLGQNPDNTPLMFTNFKNKAEGRGQIRPPIDAPKKLPPIPKEAAASKEIQEALAFMPTLQQLGYDEDEAKEAMTDDPRAVMPFPGGEDAALARLQKWMFDDDKLREYFDIRNGMLGDGYSSKLSPWLALGCISPRRIWKEAQRYEKDRTKNKSTYWLIFELTWRDFFIYMAWGQGDKIFKVGGVTGDKTPWRGSADALDRWKEGRTGDQLVDANMRELKATGFMSNRGRQNVASFLIFDLGVDWRYGASYFEETLLDYDPCSNWGNWVAAAGLTGQRVNKFNTKKQLSDYDPRREYVNHWLKGGGGSGKSGGKGKEGGERRAVLTPNAREVYVDERGSGKGGGYNSMREKGGGGKGGGGGSRRWGPSDRKAQSGQKRALHSGGDFEDVIMGA